MSDIIVPEGPKILGVQRQQRYVDKGGWHARGASVVSGPAGYQGPIDLAPSAGWVMAYSTSRAPRASRLGQNAFRLERLDDPASLDWTYDATTGLIDQTAVAEWIGYWSPEELKAAALDIFYDGTGGPGIDLHDDGSGGLPDFLFVPSLFGGRPGFRTQSQAAGYVLAGAGEISFPVPGVSFFFVASDEVSIDGSSLSNSENLGIATSWMGATYPYAYMEDDDTGAIGAGWTQPSAGIHVYAGRFEAGARELYVDGVLDSSPESWDEGSFIPHTSSMPLVLSIGASNRSLIELLIANSYMSNSNFNSVHSNLLSHYGIA